MSINSRQKYKVNKTGRIFTVHKEAYPKIYFQYIDGKREVFQSNEDDFNKALENQTIEKLTTKPKEKVAYDHPEWLKKYLIERDKIIEDENRNKTIIG